jgi:hypothetical protein
MKWICTFFCTEVGMIAAFASDAQAAFPYRLKANGRARAPAPARTSQP